MESGTNLPSWYETLRQRRPGFAAQLDRLGETLRQEGPLDARSAHLVQLAAAVAIRSEGAVHSHVRRALEAGTSREAIEHAILLLTSTVGYPNVAAALSWAEDIFEKHS